MTTHRAVRTILLVAALGLTALTVLSPSLLAQEPPGEGAGGRVGADRSSVVIDFFWGDGCPYCAREHAFLTQLEERYPSLQVRSYEVWHHKENIPKLFEVSRAHGIEPRAVPLTFIGDAHWVGFSQQHATQIEEAVKSCLSDSCAPLVDLTP